ncbi:hypothetical protein P3T37_007186 [Kitasatospora sp. MAA4]|uniref:hypothetical protein n=1 Tax=Kitasatospora sp. MAA4 TaxID=3035093 RepID=UPI0024771A18|nr:hypothetical protein [Kitasatospora sp. MAA4]MDH6137753.1 hypothetical protein [Kitasatospora sp. MAA4]
MESEPFVGEESEHEVCWFCPSVRLPAGGFDVFERPTRECAFDPADGFRYTVVGRVPVCVHPGKVGLPPGRYASEGRPMPAREPRPVVVERAAEAEPEPEAEVVGVVRAQRRERRQVPAPYAGALPVGLPQELTGLAAWVAELARGAQPQDLAEVLAGAEAAALTRFPEAEVLEVLRRVLSGG